MNKEVFEFDEFFGRMKFNFDVLKVEFFVDCNMQHAVIASTSTCSLFSRPLLIVGSKDEPKH